MRGLALLPILFLCGCAAAIAGPAQPVPARINGRGVAIAAIGLALAEGKSIPKPAQASPVPRVEAPVSDPEFPPATPHHPAPADDGWDVPKIAQPILEPEKEPELEPVDLHPVMYVYCPHAKPDPRHYYCRFCEQMKADASKLPVRCVFVAGGPDWVDKWIADDPLRRRGHPVLHFEYRGRWWLWSGYGGVDNFTQWWREVEAAEAVQARPRPAPVDTRWRAYVPRQASRYASSIHTQLSLGSIDLPTTKINLLGQAIEFVDTKESQLNEWFSILFKSGTVKHSGSSVVFSAPPQVNLRLPFGHTIELAALQSIEFVPGGADLHTDRMVIPFRVK